MSEQQKILFSRQAIADRGEELGREITEDYQGRPLVLIAVLKGAFMFLADLARAVDLPVEIDFIRVASYGDATTTSGTVRLTKSPEVDLAGKHVLLVEDIVDTGTTLVWLRQYFKEHKAASVKMCALVDKFGRRESEVFIDYAGFQVEQGFLIGYGLDYAEQYRNIPEIREGLPDE
jgi:hypoxanthine phosphoribosyltransferase